ncbi:MAG TPA: hypothetical protein VFB58_12365 [Chloroflexota bacterium]|nr:hypothetical protein [Chloroflexota bacterium]
MALWHNPAPLRRLFRSRSSRTAIEHRLYEKHESLSRATEQWVTLLRDMEHNGESGGYQYERYFQAYLQARQAQKDVDLQLFNYRQRLCE